MKIAFLSTFYPFRGGIAQFCATLLREFSKENKASAYTFTLQYPNFLFPGTTQYVEEGDKVDKVSALQILSTINPFSYIKTANKIINDDNDLLITKFWMPFFAPSLGYVAGRMRKKNKIAISILDNVIPHEMRPGDMQLIRYFLNRNDGFVVMSEKVKNDLLSIKPDAKYIFHPHPLYDHFGTKISQSLAREKLGLPKDKKILLCFGFIRDYKGLDLAIEALSKLDDSYHLVIAGEVYGNFDKYRKLIDELNLSDRISEYLQYIKDDETSIFFSAADLCLLPYKSATQSGIVATSYQFDVPIIATRVGGLAEMIEPYGSGVMASETSADAIVSAILEYENMDKEQIINNINNYKKIASWSNLSNSILNFAKELKK